MLVTVSNINWDVADNEISQKEQKKILKSLPDLIVVEVDDIDDAIDAASEIMGYCIFSADYEETKCGI